MTLDTIFIKRDEKGIAITETFKQRVLFILYIIISFALSILFLITLSFIPYRIITGKNIFNLIFD